MYSAVLLASTSLSSSLSLRQRPPPSPGGAVGSRASLVDWCHGNGAANGCHSFAPTAPVMLSQWPAPCPEHSTLQNSHGVQISDLTMIQFKLWLFRKLFNAAWNLKCQLLLCVKFFFFTPLWWLFCIINCSGIWAIKTNIKYIFGCCKKPC